MTSREAIEKSCFASLAIDNHNFCVVGCKFGHYLERGVSGSLPPRDVMSVGFNSTRPYSVQGTFEAERSETPTSSIRCQSKLDL